MFRFNILVLSSLLGGMKATAQTLYFRAGGSLTGQYISVNSVVLSDIPAAVRFHFDLGINSRVNKKLSVQFGAGYAGLGCSSNSAAFHDIVLNYMQASVSIKYYPIKSLAVYAGPYIGLLLGQKKYYFSPGQNPIEKPDDEDFGLNAGVQYFFQVNYGVGLGYQLGLQDIGQSTYPITQRNHAFQISFIFRLTSGQLKDTGM